MNTKIANNQANLMMKLPRKYVVWMEDILLSDTDLVGIANAHIGQLFTDLKPLHINIPRGFAINTDAFSAIFEQADFKYLIDSCLKDLQSGDQTLPQAVKNIQAAILELSLPSDLESEITENYLTLSRYYGEIESDTMIRSSGTTEYSYDRESMQRHPSMLNIKGASQLIKAYKECLISLFSVPAISYRKEKDLSLMPEAISMGVQKMIRSDLGVSGTLFTQDPDTGFPDTLIINASYGLGELIVKGSICPDEYRVFKPLLDSHSTGSIIKKSIGDKNIREGCDYDSDHPICIQNTPYSDRHRYALDDEQICQLARWAIKIESATNRPLNIEWAIDGNTKEIYVIQITPESVIDQNSYTITHQKITEQNTSLLTTGLAIGNQIAKGMTSVRSNPSDPESFQEKSILITSELTPEWIPFLEKSAGVITDLGGRNSYTANICRELGIPAVIGTKNITSTIKQNQEITLDSSSSEVGSVYRHFLEHDTSRINTQNISTTRVKRKLSINSPNAAQMWWKLPHQGIGMAKIESILLDEIGIHPMALVHCDEIEDQGLKTEILIKTSQYATPSDYFVDHLAKGIAQMAAVCFPQTIVVRFSHLNSKDYLGLAGSSLYEPFEENALLGLVGTSRYLSPRYRAAFDLECQAILKARDIMGFKNIDVAVPFCRTIAEATEIIEIMQQNGLVSGDNGLEIHLIVEVPSNIFSAKRFAAHFDQFAIDLDTLTLFILGLHPKTKAKTSSSRQLFDHYNPVILSAVDQLISTAHKEGVKITVFGLLEDYRSELMEYLIHAGVDAFAFEPENFVRGSHQTHLAEELFTAQSSYTPNPNKP